MGLPRLVNQREQHLGQGHCGSLRAQSQPAQPIERIPCKAQHSDADMIPGAVANGPVKKTDISG